MNRLPPASSGASSYYLTARLADGRTVNHLLTDGTHCIVGAGRNCSFSLDDPHVAALHCSLRVTDGVLWIQDWNSDAGTRLNGVPVTDCVVWLPGVIARLGGVEIVAERADQRNVAPWPEATATEPAVRAREQEQPVHAIPWGDEILNAFGAGAEQAAAGEHESTLAQNVAPEITPIAEIRSRRSSEKSARSDPPHSPTPASRSRGGASVDPFDQEMLELLRAEVEQLQEELAQRDAQLTELLKAAAEGEEETSTDEVDHPAMEALVARLEDLLEELDESEERSRHLEDELRISQEAQQADQEERRQIDAWVREIEQRIIDRDAERQAEVDVLRTHLERIAEERDHLLARTEEDCDDQTAGLERELSSLRGQVAKLEDQVRTSGKQVSDLERRLHDEDFERGRRRLEELVETRLREDRLGLAEERAALARERAELARLTAEAPIPAGQQRLPDETTGKIQAFREHLREIHEQDRRVKEGRSLTSRIARLWRRVDGT